MTEPASRDLRMIATGGILGVLVVLYFGGNLDPVLSHIGLNYKPCAEVVLTGHTICGDELEQACQSEPFRSQSPDVCAQYAAPVSTTTSTSTYTSPTYTSSQGQTYTVPP